MQLKPDFLTSWLTSVNVELISGSDIGSIPNSIDASSSEDDWGVLHSSSSLILETLYQW